MKSFVAINFSFLQKISKTYSIFFFIYIKLPEMKAPFTIAPCYIVKQFEKIFIKN